MKSRIKKITAIVGFIIIGVLVGVILTAKFDVAPFYSKASEKDVVENSAPEEVGERISATTGLQKSFTKVAEEVGKAVVSISTEATTEISGKRFFAPFGERDKFFNQFFKDFFGEMPKKKFKRRGLGSGVIIDSEGYILTNQHVVAKADKISVTLSDGREFKAEVKGEDSRSDLAVIKIDAENLPVAELGNSEKTKIGQWALAIGNPFGYVVQNPKPTVTAGIISALGRSLPNLPRRDSFYSNLIQTDAAINPGNSGGPLVNLQGEVIGINVAIFSTSGGYQGVGFAIPINRAKRILSKLKAGKEVLYGWLGVYIQNVDKELAEYFDLPDQKGVLISKVVEDSPADKAGFKAGDVIQEFNKKKIDSTQQLISIVSSAKVGKTVPVEIIRNGERVTLEVEVGKRPKEVSKYEKEKKIAKWRGIKVKPITPEMARKYRLQVKEGLIITQIEAGSVAEEVGLSEGDVILSINKKPVEDIKDFKKIIEKIGNKNALLQTNRGYVILKSGGEE